jgi:hypothetical protein
MADIKATLFLAIPVEAPSRVEINDEPAAILARGSLDSTFDRSVSEESSEVSTGTIEGVAQQPGSVEPLCGFVGGDFSQTLDLQTTLDECVDFQG